MSESKTFVEAATPGAAVAMPPKPVTKPVWQTPKIEDVSEQVMAQPYIRFT